MYVDSGLQPTTTYGYQVVANDAAGNTSAARTIESTTLADTTAPTLPDSLAVSNLTATGLTLSWAAATDDVSVTT